MEYEEFLKRLKENREFGTLRADLNAMGAVVTKLSEQINHADGPMAEMRTDIHEVKMSLMHLQSIPETQKELRESLRLLSEAKTAKNKARDRMVTIIVALLGLLGIIATALWG